VAAQGQDAGLTAAGVRVRSLRRAEEVLRANGIGGERADARGLLVPAADAMKVALEAERAAVFGGDGGRGGGGRHGVTVTEESLRGKTSLHERSGTTRRGAPAQATE
jgi:hypothetical protein